MKMQPTQPSNRGFRFRSILVHSLWITVVGVLLFRLATANTQSVLYVQIFGVSGAVLATAPWIIQLIVSTTIIFLYKAKVSDLTWLVMLPSEEAARCQDPNAIDEESRSGIWVGNGDKRGIGSRTIIDGRNNARMQRSRTV